jgi:hypothetical protein
MPKIAQVLLTHGAKGPHSRLLVEQTPWQVRRERAAYASACGGSSSRNPDRPTRAQHTAGHSVDVCADAERSRHPSVQYAGSESVHLGQGGSPLAAQRRRVGARSNRVEEMWLVSDERFEATYAEERRGRAGSGEA